MATQKASEWVTALISRFEDQLPCRSGLQNTFPGVNEDNTQTYLIAISKYRFSLVIAGLTKILQRVNETVMCISSGTKAVGPDMERNCYESLVIVLDTLERCLSNEPIKDATNFDENMNVKLLLRHICQFLDVPSHDNSCYNHLKQLASKVLFALSVNFFNAVFNRISGRLQELSATTEENPDYTDLELIQHVSVDKLKLTRILSETNQKFRLLKRQGQLVLIVCLERAIWNWMETYPQEFCEIQQRPDEELARVCEIFFDILETLSEYKKGRVLVWPLQIMLLILSPKILEEIVNADSGAPCSPRHGKKKQFMDSLKRAVGQHGNSKQQTEAGVVTCVRLCKASSYISILDSNNVVFSLVQAVISDVKSILFTSGKPYSRGDCKNQDVELMIDCFVSCFRINPHNNEALKACLASSAPVTFQYVLIASLYRIVTQPRLHWWPQIDVMYSKSAELRALFTDTLNKVTQGYPCISHSSLRMIPLSLSLKSKDSILKYKERSEDVPGQRSLLLLMVRLIHADPMLMLHNQGKAGHEIQSSTLELINGLVSLVHQPTMPDVAQEAMEALLVLHQPEKIAMWNPEAPINTFWDVSSQVLFSISQKLIQHQIVNYTDILKWLREILVCRNAFLLRNKEYANMGSNLPICKQAHIKLEVVFFTYLWSVDLEAVLVATSCFNLLCEEADIRCGSDEVTVTNLLPNYQVYQELAQSQSVLTQCQSKKKNEACENNPPSTPKLFTERKLEPAAQLQKKIIKILRKIEHCVNGVHPAWEETFRNWDLLTKQLTMVVNAKSKTEEGQVEAVYRSVVKRRTSHQCSDHDLEEQLQEWANMTGFLVALGGVCLQRRSSLVRATASTGGSNQTPDSRRNCSHAGSSQDVQYCPVTQFISQLLRLSVCNHDKVGPSIQKHVKEMMGQQMSPALYPILFDEIKIITEKFFDPQAQAAVSEYNTLFIEHIIYIMSNILDLPEGHQPCSLGINCIESIMLNVVRYVRHLDNTVQVLQTKTKLCQLVEMLMRRRDDLVFRQQLKFRNKMVEYLTDWVMGSAHQMMPPGPGDITLITRELDQACMGAVAALLRGLPLQPEESDRGDLMEAKSQLFLKYFTLFMNILCDCQEAQEMEKECTRPRGAMMLVALRNTTIQSMSNLLSANIESGLMHSIDLGYNKDLQTRAAFMEVLTKILQQGTEFDTLAETVFTDRFEQLVQLVTMISDKGELPIAMALSSVVPTSQMDELARVLVTLFDAKHLLSPLLWNMFYREIEMADSMQTLFRGNSLASKIMSLCFKMYGSGYLQGLLEPLITNLIETPDLNFEVDPSRIRQGEDIERNRRNVLSLTTTFFESICKSADRFPPQLRSMCHCLYQVLAKRYPTTPQNSIGAVGTVIFLRFFNPAIVSPQEQGIFTKPIPPNAKRGLMLLSKILQSIANHVEFSKEQHMLPFNDFLRSHFEEGRKFFAQISSDMETVDQSMHSMPYIGDTHICALHRLLWHHQEKMGDYLSSSRDHKDVGRRPFDKMVTLLAYLGPPDHKMVEYNTMAFTRWGSFDLGSHNFEELMEMHNVEEKEEFKSIKSLNIFYQYGTSKEGYPVFYYIVRRFKIGDIHGDLLIFHVILTLKPYCHAPFVLVVDFSHACSEHRYRAEFLQKWFHVLPEPAYVNIQAAYIYNCNSWVREYTKFHERVLAPIKGHKKIVFVDSLTRLWDYIDPDNLKLPGVTLALEEDVKVFNNVLRLSNKDTKAIIKVCSKAIQILTVEKVKVLGHLAPLNDVYYASEIEDVCLVDDNQFTIAIFNEPVVLSFIHNDCDNVVSSICHIRNRWELSQTPDIVKIHKKIRPKDVPGTLLNMALLNLGSSDPNLRTAAYNQLCALSATFDLKIEGRLLETTGLCIPSNNTLFIKSVSETLATNEPRLTVEFLTECIQGFRISSIDLKHLCLEYMTPWLPNLAKFCNKGEKDDKKTKEKVIPILEQLIDLTLVEIAMYPSIQAKIWGTIGQVPDLIDIVLDAFIRESVTSGLGSRVEILADTAVALASSNVQLVAKKIIGRLCRVFERTCQSPTQLLENHVLWDDIAILARYLLMLSFNNSLDVISNLPQLFHAVTFLVCSGSLSMRASTHGLVINIIHSLCTVTYPTFSEETQRVLRLSLDEFSLPKYFLLFGIGKVKSAAVTAFRSSYRHQNDRWFQNHYDRDRIDGKDGDKESLSLTALEEITDALLEILEACMKDIPNCDWLETWTEQTRKFTFSYNPALQPRAMIVFGCISKSVTDADMKQLLRILVKALENFTDTYLLEGLVICMTRLQPLLRPESPIHRALFWVAVSILEIDDPGLYAAGLALLEQNIHTLNSQGIFDAKGLQYTLMATREPLEWHFKQLDHAVGLSFKSNFHFALVGHLLKGFRHLQPTTQTRTSRVLSQLLGIVARYHKRDRFEVSPETVAYLAALVACSEEVRSRCHVKHSFTRNTEIIFLQPPANFQHSTPVNFNSQRSLEAPYSKQVGQQSFPTTPTTRRQKSWELIEQAASTQEKSFKATTPQQARSARVSVSNENNVLLDPEVLTDFTTQALVLTILATLVKYTGDEFEARVLYQYLAEASVVFSKVFPVIHSLISPRITSLLSSCKDPVILCSVQAIIQNMVQNEDNNQQLHYLQSCGFGGLWRFAGPFTKDLRAVSTTDTTAAELFVNCLEAMVETCLPIDEGEQQIAQYPSMLSVSSNLNLSSSLSSLTLGSPTDKELSVDASGESASSHGRSSFSKQRSFKCIGSAGLKKSSIALTGTGSPSNPPYRE